MIHNAFSLQRNAAGRPFSLATSITFRGNERISTNSHCVFLSVLTFTLGLSSNSPVGGSESTAVSNRSGGRGPGPISRFTGPDVLVN